MAEGTKTVRGNVDSGREIPSNETHLVHVELEIRTFDTNSGTKTSVPFVQSFYPNEFDNMEAEGHFKGYSVNVIHDPRRASAQKAGKMEAAVGAAMRSTAVDKPLDEMSKDELRIKYAELYKVQPENKLGEQALRDAIEDAIIAARGEEVATHFDSANEQSKGILNDGVQTPAESVAKTQDMQDKLDEATRSNDAANTHGPVGGAPAPPDPKASSGRRK